MSSASQQVAALLEEEDGRRLIEQFMSVAAHDLRGPLAGIQASAQVLLRLLARTGVVGGDDARNLLEGIDRQTHRMSHMLAQLLDAARIDAGQMQLACESVGLSALARGVIEGAHAETPHHEFLVDAPDAVIARVDPTRFEGVLHALVENAVKYSPDEGEIRLSVLDESDRVVIRLRDYGMGVAAQDRPHIFERFYQGSTLGPNEGLGLGLYISQQVILLHGGTLMAEFPDSGGTCFVISLPKG